MAVLNFKSASVVIALSVVAQPAALAGQQPGWAFTQKSKVTGEHNVIMTDSVLRVDSKRYGVTVYVSMPSARVTVYSHNKKAFIQTTPEGYRGMPAAYIFGNIRTELTNAKWTKAASTTVAGKPAEVRTMARQGAIRRETSRFEVDHANGVHNAVYKSLSGLRLPKSYALIVARLYAVPAFPFMPVEVIYTDPSGAENLSLYTTKCARRMIDANELKEPSGYLKARHEDELYVEKSRDAGLEAGVNWLGGIGDLKHDSPKKKTNAGAAK